MSNLHGTLWSLQALRTGDFFSCIVKMPNNDLAVSGLANMFGCAFYRI